MKISPDGKFVAVTVMNGTNTPPGSPFYNDNGILQVWTRNGTQLSKSGELPIGKWCQGVAWSANSQTLLVQCMVEEEITVVRFSGLTGRSLQKAAPSRPRAGRRASARPSRKAAPPLARRAQPDHRSATEITVRRCATATDIHLPGC